MFAPFLPFVGLVVGFAALTYAVVRIGPADPYETHGEPEVAPAPAAE